MLNGQANFFTHSLSRTWDNLNKEILQIIFQIVIDLNSEGFDCSIFNLDAQYLCSLMFGAHMVHNTSMHQIFWALYYSKSLLTLQI